MGRLTTHVLDTAGGKTASGMRIDLIRVGDEEAVVATATTNLDGRVDEPLLEGTSFTEGIYELRFYAGAYLRAQQDTPAFLDIIPIRFSVTAPDEHYHVPLLLSPFGYTTYRGS